MKNIILLIILISSLANAQTYNWPPRGGGISVPNGTPGGVLYYITSTSVGSSAAGSVGDCLKSGGSGTPTWGACVAAGAITSLNGQTQSTQIFANDTNVTVTSSAGTHQLGWSGTLSATRGGSGAALVPALGNIVYTNATNMVLLAAGTSGQVLTSQGASAPIWGAGGSGLTSLNAQTGSTQIFSNDANIIITSSSNTHALGWSGTLSVARGGTGSSSFTSGSIPYSNGTILTQDNSNLFWDGTNKFLGIGTSSPATAMEIKEVSAGNFDPLVRIGNGSFSTEISSLVVATTYGTFNVNVGIGTAGALYPLDALSAVGLPGSVIVARLSNENIPGNENTALLSFSSNRDTAGRTEVAQIGGDIIDNTDAAYKGALVFNTANNAAPAERMIIDNAGNVGIGTHTPGGKLDIVGQFRTSGTTATIGTCGISPSITGTNQSGVFTTGSGILTACTISFSATLTNAPNACIISPANVAAAAVGTTGAYVSAISTSAFIVTGLNLTSASYYYHCY